jgi:type I restriction enzyme S subunit
MASYLGASHWKPSSLRDLVFLQRGFDITKSTQIEGDVPVYSSSGLTSWHNEAKAPGPGVIIGRKGTLGSVYYSEGDYWPHDTTLWSKSLQENNPWFVYFALKCLGLERFNVGGANPTLNRNHIHDLPIRLPDRETQDAIVRILSPYDDLIENNKRRIALLEESARLLYREWFVHFRFPGHEHTKTIKGLPESWTHVTFDDVCEARGGGTPSTDNAAFWNEGKIPWYTPTDITRNSCLELLDSEKKITEAGLRGSSAKMLPAGTVLMTSRASVGYFGVINVPSCTNQGFISIVPHEPAARMYLLYNLMYRVEEIRSHAGGATYREISKGKFKALPVVLPQKDLLREFEHCVSTLHAQVRTLHNMNHKLAQARNLLLPRLMNGEIAV